MIRLLRNKKIFLKRIIRRIKYFPFFIKEACSWEFESCKRCGNIFRIRWQVTDELWQKVMEREDDAGGSLCVDCFVKLAEEKDIIIKENQIDIQLFYPYEK